MVNISLADNIHLELLTEHNEKNKYKQIYV